MTVEELEKNAPAGAFSRYDIEVLKDAVENIPDDGVYLEVGTDQGRSLWVARQLVPPAVKVWGVDLRINPKINNTNFIQGDSVEVSKIWESGKLEAGKLIDVLFIDGDHSYEGCKRDIEAWVPFVKEGGTILFHDCDETSPGVIWAVAEFANTHKVERYEMLKRTDKNTSMARIDL